MLDSRTRSSELLRPLLPAPVDAAARDRAIRAELARVRPVLEAQAHESRTARWRLEVVEDFAQELRRDEVASWPQTCG